MKNPSGNTSGRSAKPSSWISGLGGDQRYVGLGLQAGVSVGFYVGVGLLLDKWLDTLPWLTLAGAVVGIVGMFAMFVRMNRELNKANEQRERHKKEIQPGHTLDQRNHPD